jgi:predicted amidohydrolase YtcJ
VTVVPAAPPADLVVTGGAVVTMDATRPRAMALAVRDGRIVQVGRPTDVRTMVGTRTRVVELRGETVAPGFQDAHVHPIGAGLDMLRCDLHGCHGLDQYLAVTAAYVARHRGEWVTGGGWSLADFPGGTPRAADLDPVVPDRPAFLENRDGHGAWVNSRALELAGIDAATPDPPDGRIERDPDGTPSGTLHEGAARLVQRLIPGDTPDEMLEALRLAQGILHGLGITAWQDAWLTPDMLETYLRFAQGGELTARVVGALRWNRSSGLDQIETLVSQRARGSHGRFRATSVKLMLDGILENFSGAMLDPYRDADGGPTTRRGIDFIDPTILAEAVTRLDALGFQPHFHAIGDRAVRNALHAVAAARAANGPSDTRPHIAHIQVVHPDDLGRFAALGVAANAQPYWACHEPQMDELTIPFLGPERSGWQYSFRSLLRAGARVVMGSDWSVSTADPLLEMEVAVTRVSDRHREREPLLPAERLTLHEAFTAFTMGSAWVNHLDASTGSLEAGKAADFVVLDRDVFAPDAGPLGEARVVATFVAGVPVHDRLAG